MVVSIALPDYTQIGNRELRHRQNQAGEALKVHGGGHQTYHWHRRTLSTIRGSARLSLLSRRNSPMECFSVDESGYTGFDLLNAEQRFQGAAAIAITHEEASRL